jgi:hypothetical protein
MRIAAANTLPDVRFGSLADISGPCGHVGFAPVTTEKADIDNVGFVPLGDIGRLQRIPRQRKRHWSIGLPIRRIDRDAAADDPRNAGAELGVRGFFLVAEEYVTMIDDAVGFQDR